jgi:hypothetical protein
MDPKNHYSQIPQTEKPMDPFPKPRTIPDGWDLSEMLMSAKTLNDKPFDTEPPKETGGSEWDSR